MLRALCLVAALLVAANALPTTLPDGEIQHLTEEISSAQEDLKNMVEVEAQEDHAMNARVAEPAKSLLANPGEASQQMIMEGQASQQMIMEFAKVAKKAEKESVVDETKQQNLAVAALSKVDKAVETIGNSEKKSLGESDSTTKTAMEAALQKLKDVSATLHRGTKTMHTKERLERMVEESRTLKHQAHGDPMLGESLTPEEAEQHIQDAAVASIQQVQQQAKVALEQAAHNVAPASAAQDYTPKTGEGAMAMLSHTGASTAKAPLSSETTVDKSEKTSMKQNLAETEMKEISKLLKQETTVDNSEKESMKQIGSLVKDLA